MLHLFVRPNHHVLNTNIHIPVGVSVFFICKFWHQSQTLIITKTHFTNFYITWPIFTKKMRERGREQKREGEGEKEEKGRGEPFVVTLLFHTHF